MRQNLLLPYRFKTAGWILLIPSLIIGIALNFVLPYFLENYEYKEGASLSSILDFVYEWGNTIIITCLVIGVLFTAYSREKIEDELTSQIRLNSLMLALYIYSAVVILITLFVYDFDYVMYMTYSVLGFMLLFLAIFRLQLWRLRKEGSNEE
jgi:hypothetical protein